MANLSEMPQMSNSQIQCNIIYPIQYSYGYTEVPAGYPAFSISYLIYSTSHQPMKRRSQKGRGIKLIGSWSHWLLIWCADWLMPVLEKRLRQSGKGRSRAWHRDGQASSCTTKLSTQPFDTCIRPANQHTHRPLSPRTSRTPKSTTAQLITRPKQQGQQSRVIAIDQIVLGRKTCKYYYETDELSNPRPIQSKKK